MSDSQEREQTPPSPAEETEFAEDGPGILASTEQRNPRFYLQKQLVDRLTRLGVPNDNASLGRTVNELADMSVTLGYAYLPDMTDLTNLEAGVHARIEELTEVTMHLQQLLVELGATGEYRTLIHAFKQLAKTKTAPNS
jgi:hypothetical protein